MKKIGLFGHAWSIVDLPINAVLKLIFRLFALSALFSGVSVPEKEGKEVEGDIDPEIEKFQDENSENEEASASTSKEFFAATTKIRATDREGNSIEVIY